MPTNPTAHSKNETGSGIAATSALLRNVKSQDGRSAPVAVPGVKNLIFPAMVMFDNNASVASLYSTVMSPDEGGLIFACEKPLIERPETNDVAVLPV